MATYMEEVNIQHTAWGGVDGAPDMAGKLDAFLTSIENTP
jgi:hypothetical protein